MREKTSTSTTKTSRTGNGGENSITDLEISDFLPLQLIKSEIIPPSPDHSISIVDWLSDFAGFSWIAYGASSLLVISHFPSPLSQEQNLIGPIFRQVIELSYNESTVVKAVAWSPSVPSDGEIAVALENCICLFSESSGSTQGSFCWSQIAVLVQSSKVEAIKWAGSGDGIVAAGTEVVLWKRKSRAWEIAWKFTPEQPQNLVSATWSTEGPVATATYANESSSLRRDSSRCVLVSHSDRKSGLVKAELRHPQPVSMIQWRPSTGTHTQRDVLLTCCLDGTVRLWSEIDNRRAKKSVKDINDQKSMKPSFHVTAVIEINQSLNGTLGTDTFVTWAADISGVVNTGGGVDQCFPSDGSEYETTVKCEWLVGFGPRMLLTFWAMHCLDDISPLRFPRVTLWKRQDLLASEVSSLQGSGNSDLLIKAVISRSQLSGPPTVCSLFQLSSDNSMRWLQLDTLASNEKDGSLCLNGHTGSVLQVAVHPCSSEVELAVSLDSNGLLLLWLFSTVSSSTLGTPTLVPPTVKILGKILTQNLSCSKYSSLGWVPSALNEDRFLLLGHTGGIDCYIVKISESGEENLLCQKLCTIPFTGHSHGDGPAKIFAIPLPSTCGKPFISNSFMLLGIWMKEFLALSWKVVLHYDDLSGSSCGCIFDAGGIANCRTWSYTSSFAGKSYCVVADPCSSNMPDPHNHDQVTSFAVVCPCNLLPYGWKNWDSTNGLCSSSATYHMATGCSNGSLKLWRSIPSKSLTPHTEHVNLPWELVGMFSAHQGPVDAIALSASGQKIATTSRGDHSDNVSKLCIWESVRVIGAGNFLLEDNISLDGVVISLNWLAIGNGQLLLGVCMQNELRVYAQRRSRHQAFVKSREAIEMNIWNCIALGRISPAARDFLWGPRATPLLVHDNYFSLFSVDNKHRTKCYTEWTKDNPSNCMGEIDKYMVSAIFTDCNVSHIKELSVDEKNEVYNAMLPMKIVLKSDYTIRSLSSAVSQQYDSGCGTAFWSMLEVAEKLCTSLPIYHPEALLLNLYSGNLRRACVAVRHLVGYLTSVTHEKGYKSSRPSHIIPQIPLSEYFEESFSTSSLGDKGLQWGMDAASITTGTLFQRSSTQSSGYNSEPNASSNIFTSSSRKSEISGFIETLEKIHDVAAITNTERIEMLAVMDLLGEVSDSSHSSAYGGLDEPARRFWVAVRFQQLCFLRRFGRLAAMDELVVDSGLIGWAFHSDCQENLLNSVLSNEPSWLEMRKFGVGFWFTNATQLRARMEKMARLQYLKKRDPKDSALLYIALNRLQVLAGLFKVSKDEKDKPLVAFLSRNFQEETNKAAALKNAYVLMGRHQLELAIAFFLLGGDPTSAVSICAKNLGDEQLALVICRLLEGFGGPLEHHLISKILLPAAIEKGDYWLASLLEWALGNYSRSFMKFLDFQSDSLIDKSVLPSNRAAFSDPKVGQYCLMLATKNSMKNSVGESAAAMLARWATLMTSAALNRCGLPLEALECLSSSSSILEGMDQGSISDIGKHGILHGVLNTPLNHASNWLSGEVALHLESNIKVDLAVQYISKLIMEHPSWQETMLTCDESETDKYKLSIEMFQHKLNLGLTIFERKYVLKPIDLVNMILIFSCNHGLSFVGHHVLHSYLSQQDSQENHIVDRLLLYPPLPQMFLKATEEISPLFARYIVLCSITSSPLNPSSSKLDMFGTCSSSKLHAWDVYMQCLIQPLMSLRAIMKLYSSSFLTENLKAFTAIDLLEYYVLFASAWLHRDLKCLIMMIHPILITYSDGHTPSEIDVANLKKILHQSAEIMSHDLLNVGIKGLQVAEGEQLKREQGGRIMFTIPEDEKWKLIGACLWRLLSKFTKDQLKSVSDGLEDGYSSRSLSSSTSSHGSSESDGSCTLKQIKIVPVFLAELLMSTLACISTSHVKQLASLLRQKVEKSLPVPTLVWLQESNQSQSGGLSNGLNQGIDSLQLINKENESSLLDILWEISANRKEIGEGLAQEKIWWLQYISQKSSKGWRDMDKGTVSEIENAGTSNCEQEVRSITANGTHGSADGRKSQENHSFLGSRHRKEVTSFLNPEDIYKKNGQLLEAMCINSTNQQQAAVASNRKGIIFINLRDELSREQSGCIWYEADWPKNGWAGTESTPVPTFVSPGIGLGSEKGTHLGLGGATVGLGSLVRPGRDMTGGGAFGIPGYAGIGASGLGWGTQQDFEEFVDPPATVENISTRALSSHPSRPLFLVGSRNTHVYLWEFGKERATATYGVLPAANVPPPYALASISALKFDHYGHRFVTAALDGTVCTWQLEVGGRSNICPTESSICFNSHASDVTYVAGSGSVIAAAGYSSNGANVVIWDTLAPPATSQASLVCHEGGALSISVFDNDIGSGSISPSIVTGGKGGDVGLHDFRFIATGKTKRHKHSNTIEPTHDTRSGISNKSGEQNGMLWYIPKAHLGSVTRVSTIPNTSLFLTGSKDGDVKLWDAKRSELVFHWPKLHERHTFLQPSSRGFGGVVQDAVTDIQLLSHGFLTCGGDGTVKLVQLKDFQYRM
ncbi:WD40 repeat [Macleaya cordata]|uniref:WD40 repeat n=1 Tax=Macleaya cordata TaxID=56857 RepID=A0A200QW88_MACCD|nr:WD40 repeat [Macleaya cordata]